MPTSGTDTYSPNRIQVIQDALEMNGHDVYGETDPAITDSASRSLNALIKALNVNQTDVNVIVQTSFDTVAADKEYDVDALGIDGMRVTANATDTPVIPFSSAQYNAIYDKAATGRPTHFYHDKQANVLHLYPVPDAVYTVTYGRVRQYEDMTDGEQTFDFPSSAIEMLTFGLAHRFSFKSGLDLGSKQLLESQFEQAKRRYTVANYAYTKGQRATSNMVV